MDGEDGEFTYDTNTFNSSAVAFATAVVWGEGHGVCTGLVAALSSSLYHPVCVLLFLPKGCLSDRGRSAVGKYQFALALVTMDEGWKGVEEVCCCVHRF